MDESLNELWSIGQIEKIAEDGDMLTYSYRFDSEDEDDNGVIQFDRYVLEEIRQGATNRKVIDMFISRRVSIIKKCRHNELVIEGEDLGVIVAFKIILDSYLENNSIPNVQEVLNLKALERMKETYPEGYEEMMKIIDEETKRLTS